MCLAHLVPKILSMSLDRGRVTSNVGATLSVEGGRTHRSDSAPFSPSLSASLSLSRLLFKFIACFLTLLERIVYAYQFNDACS